jgi:prophage tail gpP-like protein
MRDNVVLSVNGRQIDFIESYSVDSDLFMAASAFTFEYIDKALFVEPGMQAKLFINNICEMSGIIDRVEQSKQKGGKRTIISGRDMMGLLCDHCCEDFGVTHKFNGKTIRQIAETLIRTVPFIKKENIIFQAATARLDKIYNFEKINPGETVFEVLKRCATGRGLLFYCLPNGTFIFGKAKERGPASFTIISRKKNTLSNNAISGSLMRDISQCYSKITVLGDIQSLDDWDSPTKTKVSGSAFIPGNIIPYYKPQILTSNKDNVSPAREAAGHTGRQIAESLVLEYTVPLHSQNGSNWRINEICSVEDDDFKIAGSNIRDIFLIYGRTFTRDKRNGSITMLRLGYPGVIISV